jgi:hypothetical protein
MNTSAKTLFPNKVTFPDVRARTSTHCRVTIQPIAAG